MTIQYFQGLNMFVITELTIATLFVITELTIATLLAQVLVMRHLMTCSQFLCFSSGLTCGLLKNHRTPQ